MFLRVPRPVKPAINSPHSAPWLEPIGKLVVNFASLELQTYWWLGTLARDRDLPRRMLGKPFKARVDRILELIPGALDDVELVGQCSGAWSEALEIARFRNSIVHNPVAFGWSSTPETGPPDIVGIPDVAHLGPRPPLSQRIASLEEINAQLNATVKLSVALYSLLERCDTELGPPAATK